MNLTCGSEMDNVKGNSMAEKVRNNKFRNFSNKCEFPAKLVVFVKNHLLTLLAIA